MKNLLKYNRSFYNTNNMYYLDVPFEEKEEAKKLGCKWDTTAKKWYRKDYSITIDKWIVVYLDVPFHEKDGVKELGGKWDVKNKKWYIGKGKLTTDLEKYIV